MDERYVLKLALDIKTANGEEFCSGDVKWSNLSYGGVAMMEDKLIQFFVALNDEAKAVVEATKVVE